MTGHLFRHRTKRKQHNDDDGYIAERMNPHVPGRKVVIYLADEQGIDVDPDRYAVVCDAHSTLCGTSNIPRARELMKNPTEFCQSCRDILVARP